ncbi:MAG TPA: hypothetical protein VND94_15000 [Terriglobia bacterium]|nr:hypothetical protein [Terriglobia bacterium]
MDVSSVIGVAAGVEGARNAGIQQASSSATSDQVKRDTKKQQSELDLKHTDLVAGADEASVSKNKTHKLNVLV